MAVVPSLEAQLFALHKCLALPPAAGFRIRTEVRQDFADLGLSTQKHGALVQHLMEELLAALDLDADSTPYALTHFLDWSNFYLAVQRQTWTGSASAQQVLWHVAGNVHAASLGRYLGPWAMDNALGQGMPAGPSWFLPTTDASTKKVQLPVPKVIDWLLDLYGAPMDALKWDLGSGTRGQKDAPNSFERNLYNWRRKLPQAQSIKEMFSDVFDLQARFQGTFEVDDALPIADQAAAARAFVRDKGITADVLRNQIPMAGTSAIEGVLEGTAPAAEAKRFVGLLRARYSRPPARLIRQRLGVARLFQGAYEELCEFLEQDPLDGDSSRNKVLQLIAIFTRSYDLTVEAHQAVGHLNEEAEDRFFESHLLPWEALGSFTAVLPSRKGHAHTDVASNLSRTFAALRAEDGLADLVRGDSDEGFEQQVKDRVRREIAEAVRYAALLDKVRRSSPWRALQGESSFEAVHQLVTATDVGSKVRHAAVERLEQLATSPQERMLATLARLHALLNCREVHEAREIPSQVEAVLLQGRSNPAVGDWQAPLLAFEAKHLLSLNDWRTALARFRDALRFCSQTSHGPLRGEVARDGWGLAIALDRFQQDQEIFYRSMLAFDFIRGQPPTMEDAALEVADRFWNDLYKPYPGVERRMPAAAVQAREAMKPAMSAMFGADWAALGAWFKQHQRLLAAAHMKEVRGDTVLTQWIKMSDLTGRGPLREHQTTSRLHQNWLKGIEMLVEAWPGQVNMADFKGQTPLMLAIDGNLDSIVAALLRSASVDINAQDYLGRTALHAAVTANSLSSVLLLLDREPELQKVTHGEAQTVLHTAARLGRADIAARVCDEYPFLLKQRNVHDRTPLEECDFCLREHEAYCEALQAQRRLPASREMLQATRAVLVIAP